MRRLLLTAAAVVALALASTVGVQAKADKVTVCHAAGQAGTTHFVTLEVPANEGGFPQGHFTEDGTTAAGHEDDYLGACEVAEPTPSPSPAPTASPEPTPSPEPTEVAPTPTPDTSSPPEPSTAPEPTPDTRVMPPTDTDEGGDTLGALVVILLAAAAGGIGGLVEARRHAPKD